MNKELKKRLGLPKADIRVLENLVSYKNYVDTSKLAKRLNLNLTTIQRAVKRLYESPYKLIQRKQINLNGGGYLFKYKVKPYVVVTNQVINLLKESNTKLINDLTENGW